MQLFNCRRNRASEAAKQQWPGNDLPTSKNNKAAQKTLGDLVTKLIPTCEAPNFSKSLFRKHFILITPMNEDDRKGYDYENASCIICSSFADTLVNSINHIL